ncbi:natriuretic peptide A-like [Kryptolebias marmoratus]|uniref:Natriuretic peptide A-like n=1 Tax=Kryptolebias marmoratus TaxID=37003 RepID=A0A3Q3AL44_KRYMA|nr:natriuretic peptide A-like [Kryptolebias marmoratus]XP_017292229.1 natriuretic peptide A-like [Kryptolebias marmoratus]
MNPNVSVWCLFLLLVHDMETKPISNLQSLKQLFEDELSTTPFSSEDRRHLNLEESTFGSPEPWSDSELAVKDNALARLLKDFMRTSKRSWSRYKKGGLKSCFGVRLERIGSFSGLGC